MPHATTCHRVARRNAVPAARRIVFGIALASFVLSFFHRTAPAAVAGELTLAFSINSAVLGTLAATYFFVYTVLQIPVGVLADTLGPSRILAAGSLIAGIGSLLFALASTWEVAAAGRTLVGVGVSVAFIAFSSAPAYCSRWWAGCSIAATRRAILRAPGMTRFCCWRAQRASAR